MKLLLFSRRGVVHAADELRRTFAAIARYGFDFVVNKEFAETIRSLGVAQIPAEKEYGCNACPPSVTGRSWSATAATVRCSTASAC